MKGIRRVFRLRPNDVERDVDEELRFHLESRAAALERQGMSPESARQQAVREFGDLDAARGDLVTIDTRRTRSQARADWWHDVGQDVRIALRGYLKRPGYTAVILLTLATAIGANSTIFSIAEAVLLRGLPFHGSGQLVHVYETQRDDPNDRTEASYPDLQDWRAASDIFVGFAGSNGTNVTVSDAAGAVRERGLRVTPDFFQTLGVQLQRGRTFTAEEDLPDGSPVVVITHDYWQRHFGSDEGAVGRTIQIDQSPHTVIGILPRGFRFAPASDVDLWFTLGGGTRTRSERFNHWVSVVGRLKPGVTLEAARARMTQVATRLASQYPETNSGRGVFVMRLRDAVVGPVEPTLTVLLGAVAIVLIIACANVGSLVLTRSIERGSEIAVRAALGASRIRLVRQLVTENLVIALVGGALGAWIAWQSVRALVSIMPANIVEQMPHVRDAGVNVAVLGYTLLIAGLTGILFGLAPALVATHGSSELLRGGGRAGTSRTRHRLRDGLVACEIACTVVLIVAATLMARSLARLFAVDPGFRAEHVVTARFPLSGPTYRQDAVQRRFFEEFMARVRALPGVQSVGAITNPPLQGGGTNTFRVEGENEPPPSDRPEATRRGVAGDYFSTMGIRLVEGRVFSARDDSLSPRVIVVSQALARRHFGSRSAVGGKLRFYAFPERTWEIVGVVGDVKTSRLDAPAPATVYYTHLQVAENRLSIVAKTSGDERALLGAIGRVAHDMEPALPLYGAHSMRDQISETPAITSRRFPLMLIGGFALAALGLAIVGVYGVIAYSVAQRTRELALRVALGATNGDVIALMLRRGALLALVGIAVGVPAALLLSRSLGALLYSVSAADAMTYVGVTVVLAGVALLASYIPSRRATRVDPAMALRAE